MTAFLALIRKDLILYLGDTRALLLNLLMPIVLAAFFGSLFGGAGEAKTGKVDVALVQQDSSAVAARIAAGLKADPALRVTAMSAEQARQQVGEGKQKVAIVLPAGFGEAAGAALFGTRQKPEIGLLYDPSQLAVLSMVKGMLTQQVMQVVSAEMFGGKTGQQFTENSLKALEQQAASDPDSVALRNLLVSLKTFQGRVKAEPAAGGGVQQAGLAMPFTTRDQPQSGGNDKLAGYNGYSHSFAGMAVQFILFMGVDTGIGILLARRMGIWNRLLAAPVSISQVLLARAASAAIIAFALISAIFLCAVVVFKVTIANPAGFVGVAVCFALMTASFGLLIAAFGKTPEAARGLATFATLIMVMLGGAWIPSFLFPDWVQTLTVAIPTRWAVDGFDAMTWRGLGIDAALRAMLAQLGFAALFGTLAIWKFRLDHK